MTDTTNASPEEGAERMLEMADLQTLYSAYPVLNRMILFPPGRVVLTPGAAQALGEHKDTDNADLLDYLVRHLTGDWGDLDALDRRANDEALRSGGRLLSSYWLPNGQKLWLITEADRSATTALLPEEY